MWMRIEKPDVGRLVGAGVAAIALALVVARGHAAAGEVPALVKQIKVLPAGKAGVPGEQLPTRPT
jgi:hypothetical protein